ncbi:uncharacterized protein J7T54_005831 [Emericellopsis cladophorae]|uniref:Rhodopsin domain-containing protein n=1 Tax=Emericellopsis cladophorae TaxID=2686198 RepID=A0A9P9XV55_9HYPO|nr:uncharacterized protein J7T54_005831 [Emericellopsis cladophorae]KAI6778315.1 hypothetical protein J7T54_005831 [Emericellopsis cladophorae]
MALEPGLEPPSGQVSNFDNPDRHMFYYCIAANVTGVAVTTVFMGLRLWARRRLSMRLQADDVACIVGYIGFVIYCGICLLMLRFGGGIHQWDVVASAVPSYNQARVPRTDMVRVTLADQSQAVYATMVNYGPTVLATKAAILLFLNRIFAPYKGYVALIYSFLGIMAVYYTVMFFLKIFICRPIPVFWGEGEGECFNQRVLILVDNVISLMSDIVVFLLPCPLAKQLQVGLMAKVKIAVVFGVGGIACIFSLIRLIFIINRGNSPDQTYVFMEINLTGVAEVGIGLVCATLPLMPALWKSIRHEEKVGYWSQANSNFEMFDSHKRSRNATRDQTAVTYNDPIDSDEHTLIPGKGCVTTQIQGGGEGPGKESAGSDATDTQGKPRIMLTTEVRQTHEG